MIAKQEQMANKADWSADSAHGKANPCCHTAYIFVEKTTQRIDLRLTLPKLHLAIIYTKIESRSAPTMFFIHFFDHQHRS